MIVGIDMGGTHIDGVLIEDKNIVKKIKNRVDNDDLFKTVWTSLRDLIKDIDIESIKRINLSTTVSTNAIVEDKLDKVGMIVQAGPGINNKFLNVGEDINEIEGYIDHRGKIVRDVDYKNIEEIKREYIEKEIDSVGIVTKFSIRNPSHELAIGELFDDDFNHISYGHRMSGRLNFPRRVNTTYLNEAVYSRFKGFYESIDKSLRLEGIDAPVYVLKADGGTMDLDHAVEMPVETIMSGPAASFMGMKSLFSFKEDGLLLDIGGTTTDIFFLLDGEPVFEQKGIAIGGYKTLVRSIYSLSIGVGGDSSVEIEEGELKVGPIRKDQPLVFGGKYPTPTDAMVVLGYLDIGNKDRALEGIRELGEKLDIGEKEVAQLILKNMVRKIKTEVDRALELINSAPVYTVKEVLYDRKLSPKDIKVIGGPAKILRPYLEDEFSLDTDYPENYMITNAIGAGLARPTMELNLIGDTGRDILSIPELGIYKNIDKTFNLDKARNMVFELLKKSVDGITSKDILIVEENVFNMIDGFREEKNIRIKAQVKPGFIYELRGEIDEG